MKRVILVLSVASLMCSACFPTRIVTYSPTPSSSYYSTTVTPSRTNTVTTITQAYTKNSDISLHLDLQAVVALFAQASSVQNFEQMLNNGNYPVSNLDLNHDGYIDYLRVLETIEGYNHVYLIQACIGQDIYQDVATLVAEVPSYSNYSVEIIGAPFIYGSDYYLRPVFIDRPAVFDSFRRPGYAPWHSPWHWGNLPNYYRRPAPVYLNHYQAYVNTFMTGHRYCHEMSYPQKPHYADYERMARPNRRNDYGMQHPDQAFSVRNANYFKADNKSEKVRNAYDVRRNNESSKQITTSPKPSNGNRPSGTGSTTGAYRSGGYSRSAESGNATPSRPQSGNSSSNSTVTNSRVRPSGSSSTTVRPSQNTNSGSGKSQGQSKAKSENQSKGNSQSQGKRIGSSYGTR